MKLTIVCKDCSKGIARHCDRCDWFTCHACGLRYSESQDRWIEVPKGVLGR